MWVASYDGENFGTESYEDRDLAIEVFSEEAKEDEKSSFYIGRKVEFEANHFVSAVDASAIIESMQELASEEGGEWGEDYLTYAKPDQVNELELKIKKVVSEWIVKHGYTPTFFRVTDIEVIELEP